MNQIRLTSQAGRRAAVRLPLLAAALCGICLTSCTDDMGREPVPSAQVSFLCTVVPATSAPAAMPQGSVVAMQGGSSPLYLHTLHSTTVTRATPVTSDNMYSSFGVSAYQYTDAWSGTTETPNFFYNQTAAKQTDGGYALTGGTYYWPGAAYSMRFFAYAPVDNDGYVLSAETAAGAPTVTVTVPSDVAKQQDLLVAASDELAGNNGSAVSLNFSHALTAVRFVCGDDMLDGTVNSITISGVYNTGTYNMFTGEWTVSDSSTADFSQTLDETIDGTEGTCITGTAETFMMIPQTLPVNAKLTVNFTDSNSGKEHKLTANIGKTMWTKGQAVTYRISSNSINNYTYMLSVTAPAATYGCTGGTQQYTVSSYRTHSKTSNTQAVAWTTEYSEDGGNTWTDSAPAWLTDFTASGDGGTDAVSYDATVGAQTTTSTGSHIYKLQTATERGTADVPYNLANQTDGGTTVENTANCYVVNAPGYYSFPLVYGNAIKDSQTNATAYTSTVTDNANVLTPFVNHLGSGITSPYIAENTGCTPATAELVWQDAKDLVTDIEYNSDDNGGNISFYVDRATIRQGNAVIAVKDAAGTVLWSWHIWVTDETISADNTIAVTNYQKTVVSFMPVNLGWCDGETVTFGTATRSCQVRFIAGNGSNEQTKTITITQSAGTVTTYDGSPYYQWGRKDPFLPSNRNGTTFTNKTWYNASGTSSTANPTVKNLGTGSSGVKNYILNPGVMTSSNGDNTYYNLWSANNSIAGKDNLDVTVVKTVYDPSPVGFSVPYGYAYTGFTKTGSNTSKEAEVNGTWDDASKSYSFNADTKGVTILFPFMPFRNRDNANIVGYGQSIYWAAVPYSLHTGCYLYLKTFANVSPTVSSYRGYGSCVRPAKEQ